MYRLLVSEVFRAPSAEASTDFDMEDEGRFYDHVVRIPMLFCKLEGMMLYGCLCCLDVLLWCALAPLRLACALIFRKCFDRRDAFTICFIIASCLALNLPLQTLRYANLYHTVRASSSLKLYMIFNILEVVERLLAAFGSDVVEAMFVASHRNYLRAACLMIVSCGYCAIHTVVLLLQVVSINVALNSDNNALFALLVSNNFIEVKGHVFKKYTVETLFQVACADVVERMQYLAFTIVLMLQHLQSEGVGTVDLIEIGGVLLCEVVVDSIKHGFVTKFNSIKLSSYKQYIFVLREDVVREKVGYPVPSAKQRFVPHPVRRMGFVPFPYLALVLWAATPAVEPLLQNDLPCVAVLFLCVAVAKVLLSVMVVGHATKRFPHGSRQARDNYAGSGKKRSPVPVEENAETSTEPDPSSSCKTEPVARTSRDGSISGIEDQAAMQGLRDVTRFDVGSANRKPATRKRK